MKIFKEKDVAAVTPGKVETQEAAVVQKPTVGSQGWVETVYGATPRPKLFERADAVSVTDIKFGQ